MRSALFGAGAMLATAVLFWIGGVDFDHRGFDTAYFLVCAVAVGMYVGWCCHSENSKP